ECEEIFFNKPLINNLDEKHSQYEKRFRSLGKTNINRRLLISYTIRNQKVRIISARDQNKKERRIYEKA
ncbi:BrnT family toxin, partial [Patescibacteria group bacterium]|nr:BrnT family toxin [Patescibacteria group bacterium]MBU1457716.1 BrnT family toxin [Patescibacteria group bacterium]